MRLTRKTSSAGTGGFTLLELLFIVALLGFFAIGASEVFRWALAIPHRADRAAANLTQADTIIRHMRRDVWGADTIDLTDSQNLRLHLGSGQVIVWHLTDGHKVSRTGPDVDGAPAPAPGIPGSPGSPGASNERTWSGSGLPQGFAPSRTGVLLRVAAPDAAPVHLSDGGSSGSATEKVVTPPSYPTRLIPLVSQLRILNLEEAR